MRRVPDIDEDPGSNGGPLMQIGEVAERTGLSLRTVRYYEEVGLVVPSERSSGGFRLYRAADVERLQMVRDMKPLGFSLDEMRELLDVLESLEHATPRHPEHEQSVRRLDDYAERVASKCAKLRRDLDTAQRFSDHLQHLARMRLRDAMEPQPLGAEPRDADQPR